MLIKKCEFTLRDVTINDFGDIHEYASNIENLKYNLWGPNSKEETLAFIKDSINNKKLPRRNYEFVIEIEEEKKLKVIGGCGIYLNEEMKVGEVGWTINKKYWNKGYGTLVGRALIEFGFESLGLEKIFATCDRRNIGSYRVMEKCHMIKEALRIGVRPSREIGKWEDELKYSILKENYIKRI